MTCHSCGQANRVGARFCASCGEAMRAPCKICGRALGASARFCDHCGATATGSVTFSARRRPYTPRHLAERILTARAALLGERKHVTVLFADVVGSVALSEALDPEDWHEVLDGLFELLADGVHRFEGTVNQYTGDGIMGIFGAPTGLEDHAQRACHAALHLRDALAVHGVHLRKTRGIDVRMRIALSSGEVVVGAIGDDLRMDYTAQGPVVGLAARIQAASEPGRVFLADSTAALVGGWFELRDLGPRSLRGLARPVRVFELLGVASSHTRLEASRERGLTPFVGRAEELDRLVRALGPACNLAGKIIGVAGEAGVGKSRLCLEFARLSTERGVTVCAAACPSHASMLPSFLLRDLVRSLLDLPRGAAPGAETTARITDRLAALDAGLAEQTALLLELLQLPDPAVPSPALDSQARRDLLLATLERILAARARERPVVVLLDDLHWIDAESDALLSELVGRVSETGALFVVNFRPEYHAPWMKGAHYEQIDLAALADDPTLELIRSLLGGDPSLDGLVRRLCEVTRGNPFFVEEVVHGLVDRGVLAGRPGAHRLVEAQAALAIPSTVQSVLTARIDRLPERDKTVLQVAAIAGRRFPARLVALVTGFDAGAVATTLDALCAAQLLLREPTHSAPEYLFRHPLTHEVAYETQLRARRRELHAALAWVLAEQPATTAEENASLVAHHLEQAGVLLEAARWRWRAVEAIGWNDAAAIVPHLRHVNRLTDALPGDRAAMRLGIWSRSRGLADALLSGIPFEEAERFFQEGRELAGRLGHLPALATLHGWHANFLNEHGLRVRARGAAAEAQLLAAESGSRRALVQISYGVLQTLLGDGRLHEALTFSEQVIEAARERLRAPDVVVAAHARLLRAEILELVGRLRESLAQGEQALATGAGESHPQVAVGVMLSRARVCFFLGEVESHLEAARLAVELADRWKDAGVRSSGRRRLGHALLCMNRPAEALAILDEAEPLERAVQHSHSGLLELLRACALAALGRVEAARQQLDCGWERASREQLEASFWTYWHMAHGLLALDAVGERARIERLLDEMEALVTESAAVTWAPYVRIARAELARTLGSAAATKRHLEEATKELRAMGAVRAAERLAGS